MNRYEFENLISDYLEGELSFSKRKEFELYLKDNENASSLFYKVKNTLFDMKRVDKVSTSSNFNSKLLMKIKDETPSVPYMKNDIFGLSPIYASIFSILCLAVTFIIYSLINPESSSNSKIDYSLVPIDKSQKFNQSQVFKNNSNYIAKDQSDSSDVNGKDYKPKKTNKIKFVNY
tara:strand:+ start:501 stop:1025 length:525 start_codon:yes stop_codon:yes gene_type:complete